LPAPARDRVERLPVRAREEDALRARPVEALFLPDVEALRVLREEELDPLLRTA
jgi:hypothetical protein